MSGLDRILPTPRLVELDTVELAAEPERVWQLLRHGDLGRSPLVRALFAVRTSVSRAKGADSTVLRLDDMASTPEHPGFQILVDEAPFEVVVGAIGKVWQLDIPFVHVPDADHYEAFDEPGYIKVAWAIRLAPLGERDTRVTIEVRVGATDDAAWKKFRAYFRLIGPGSHFIRRSVLASLARELGAPESKEDEGRVPRDDWRDVLSGMGGAGVMVAAFLTSFARGARNHWGIDAALAERRYPGDELVSEPRWSWTHGIEIDATPEQVWPWIAQLGAERAGFYSYQWLENLAGCDLRNAETIHPEWAVRQGSSLSLHPKMPPLSVIAVAPNHYFVAYGPADIAARAAGRPWIEVSWLFYLEPIEGGRCRFISRYRAASSDDLTTRLQFGPTLIEPIGFAMDRRMLLGVKQRVERAARAAS